MASTIRVNRAAALEKLKQQLVAQQAAWEEMKANKQRYEQARKKFDSEVAKLAKKSGLKIMSVRLKTDREYDSDLEHYIDNGRVVVTYDLAGMTLPTEQDKSDFGASRYGRWPDEPDYSDLERAITLLEMAVDETVPVSLFKNFQSILTA